MTQGAGQGPEVWHDATAADGAGRQQPAVAPPLPPQPAVAPPPLPQPVAQPPLAQHQVPQQPAPGEPVAAEPVAGQPVAGQPVPQVPPAVPAVPAAPHVPPQAAPPAAPHVPPQAAVPQQARDPYPQAGPGTVSGVPPVPPLAPPPPAAPVAGLPATPAGPAATAAPPFPPGEQAGGTADPATAPTAQPGLPVLGGTDADVLDPTLAEVPGPDAVTEGEGPLFVVGDVHGYLDELRAALRQAGLVDAEDNWIAGTARLWFLGDFTDRGPDGVGVIDLVMHLSAQAAAAGGYCKALMGNHELLLLGARRFGDTPVGSGAGTASFQAAWLLNGGQHTDMERLEEHHVQWMSRLDAMALADDHLLLHSDASCYLDYGNTIDAVNDAVTVALQHNDADETWELFRKFTKRFAFRDEETGAAAAAQMLATFGGRQIVHGHSPIPYLTGEVGSEDEDFVPNVPGPHVYADGLAVAMDGGVTMAGKLLVSQLPLVG